MRTCDRPQKGKRFRPFGWLHDVAMLEKLLGEVFFLSGKK
jgi:hypothetical protein